MYELDIIIFYKYSETKKFLLYVFNSTETKMNHIRTHSEQVIKLICLNK